MASITEREEQQVEQANASGRTPVVFIHGLWLLPSSWDRWTWTVRRIGRNRPPALSRRLATANFLAEIGDAGAGKSPQPRSRSDTDTRSIPLRLGQRPERRGNQAALRDLPRRRAGRAAISGGDGKPQP